MTVPARVLLHISDLGVRERILRVLAGTPLQLLLQPPEVCAETPLEDFLVLTDQRVAHGGAFVIALGEDLSGDLTLNGEWTDRELRLACTLAAEVVALRRDGKQIRRQADEYRELARLDPLTGLPNRRAWSDFRAQLETEAEPIGTILLDLDGLKRVNTNDGLAAGDGCLIRVAEALRSVARARDFVGRVGGDEFLVVLRPVTHDRCRSVVERIRQAARLDLQSATRPTAAGEESSRESGSLTVSAGFATGTAQEIADLLTQADEALRYAKRSGRDRAFGVDASS